MCLVLCTQFLILFQIVQSVSVVVFFLSYCFWFLTSSVFCFFLSIWAFGSILLMFKVNHPFHPLACFAFTHLGLFCHQFIHNLSWCSHLISTLPTLLFSNLLSTEFIKAFSLSSLCSTSAKWSMSGACSSQVT